MFTSAPRYRLSAQYFTESLSTAVSLDMVYIHGGSFLMGSLETEEGNDERESPQHSVTVPAFFMGKYPITQAQWHAVAKMPIVNQKLKANPSHFKGNGDLPVEQVSWHDAVEFCDRLSRKTQRAYRLPSEAEWEYACRAGTTTPFHFGETIEAEIANYDANRTYGDGKQGEYRSKTTPVGSFQLANRFGLYDMHGNVLEWCLDHWHENYEGVPTNGSAWIERDREKNAARLLRGGSWLNFPVPCRSASRHRFDAAYQVQHFGFRVVCGFSGEDSL
jgi:formylglycine-generating enzyme required for sulfatase activity